MAALLALNIAVPAGELNPAHYFFSSPAWIPVTPVPIAFFATTGQKDILPRSMVAVVISIR
jgi:hypothetical protein